jgi:hypothetical protein
VTKVIFIFLINKFLNAEYPKLFIVTMRVIKEKETSRLLPMAVVVVDVDFILFLQRITMTGFTISRLNRYWMHCIQFEGGTAVHPVLVGVDAVHHCIQF